MKGAIVDTSTGELLSERIRIAETVDARQDCRGCRRACHHRGLPGCGRLQLPGDKARKDDDLSWTEWGERFTYFLERVARVFTPAHFIIGGGASKKLEKFADQLTLDTPVRVAHFKNNAGIIGAAIAADGSSPK